ncbi:MAG: hypothetical protein ACK5LO_07255 [Leucobacter sp.]
MKERYPLDLTGPGSHVLVREPGQADVSVGPTGCDLVVGALDEIDWNALGDPGVVTADWPDRVRYEGADASIARWATGRDLYSLHVTAAGPLELDLSRARLRYLTLESRGHRLAVRLPSASVLGDLHLVGTPVDLALERHPDGSLPGITLTPPRTSGRSRGLLPSDGSAGSRPIDPHPELLGAESLAVYGDPFDVPPDARSLTPYAGLRELEIRGAVAHLEALTELPLRSLQFRFVPNLAGLPPLSVWPNLDEVIVWNCDAEATKRVRSEIRRMPAGEKYRSASQGRAAAWFVAEYGLPFSAWPRATASKATRAFKAAAKTIAGAGDRDGALAAIEEFVRAANVLPGIETSEREDLGDAVLMLAGLRGDLDGATALRRFDAVRDF